MKRLSDLNIKIDDDRKIFECPLVSITEVINCEIEVIEFISEVKTKHGDGRYIVMCKTQGRDVKFFTNSSNVKKVLDAVDKNDFPFLATIKSFRLGSSVIYKFI